MIRLTALNNQAEEESRSEDEVTREALEQIALQQYTKALELRKKGKLSDATKLLKDLLETELLHDVQKPEVGEVVSSTMLNLKYLCFKNLASLLTEGDQRSAAIDAYNHALNLDNTDVTVWQRLGLLCMQEKRYEAALQAFRCGINCVPNHWPCLDKIVLLLKGLGSTEECISVIYDTLKIDSGYMRALVYRRHIFTIYPYIKTFMEYIDPKYKWDELEEWPIDEAKAESLLKEAEDIHDSHLEQLKQEQTKLTPPLKLNKPISKLTWKSVGESLIDMHHHITQKLLSHACPIGMVFEKETEKTVTEVSVETKEVESLEANLTKIEENQMDIDKNNENCSENENFDMSDKDKTATDTEKVESDVEIVPNEPAADNPPEAKKKPTTRRRGSALSFLEQWEWCTKRRSGRKKCTKKSHDNIYDTLRKMIPAGLSSDVVNKEEITESSPLAIPSKSIEGGHEKQYFGSEDEQNDVRQFITKYTEPKHDIISILEEYLMILAEKWNVKWPEYLPDIFTQANKCYRNHVDIPSCADYMKSEIIHFIKVNLLVEEFTVNKKLNSTTNDEQQHNISVVEAIGLKLNSKPHIFSEILPMMLRYIWIKLHIHILNKNEECALDCLYQLSFEFEAMGELGSEYSLNVVNFTFKPLITDEEISVHIKFLERNKKLSTVYDLFESHNYEEVLSILKDSYENCKDMAKKQEEEMSLHFSLQLTLILDTYRAMEEFGDCLKWSFICLNEALKHYFRVTSGSLDYAKWTDSVEKILWCMEYLLSKHGLLNLDMVSESELSQGLENLIRIIGHQVETNATDMPIDTIAPWIIMHFILQREEDQGRGRTANYDAICDDVPNTLMILFIAHEQLGNRGWCCKSDAKLLYFILDTVTPRLRAPYLAKSLEQINQYMEQCVYCLYGHPGKKHKLKYLADHNVRTRTLDWKRAQQIYEIFRPISLPELEGKIPAITSDTECLFQRILALLPADCDPQKYVPEVEKYIKGVEEKLPSAPLLLPYKMRDIYFLLGDYYFKKEEGKMAIKYNMYDVIVNSSRLESWAEIALAKTVNLERILNSCKNLDNEKEFLNPAKSIIRCFKRALQFAPTHCNILIEYGVFVYTVHSFCSRLLKQASESLSMEDFESLEKQKEDMLDTTQKCFMAVLGDINDSTNSDKTNEDSWLQYYILGKVAEKRNKPPSMYLQYYMEAVKSLQETDATYPLKINYSSPTRQCIEVLELNYRIHASILKYIEQHENKPIPMSVGKVFATCIKEWQNGPFIKKSKKEVPTEVRIEANPNEPIQAANILKRSASDASHDDTNESKRLKLVTAAAKVRRSASYDTERVGNKDSTPKNAKSTNAEDAQFTLTIEGKIPSVLEIDIDLSTAPTNNSTGELTFFPYTEGNITKTVELGSHSTTVSIEANLPTLIKKSSMCVEAKSPMNSEANLTVSGEAKLFTTIEEEVHSSVEVSPDEKTKHPEHEETKQLGPIEDNNRESSEQKDPAETNFPTDEVRLTEPVDKLHLFSTHTTFCSTRLSAPVEEKLPESDEVDLPIPNAPKSDVPVEVKSLEDKLLECTNPRVLKPVESKNQKYSSDVEMTTIKEKKCDITQHSKNKPKETDKSNDLTDNEKKNGSSCSSSSTSSDSSTTDSSSDTSSDSESRDSDASTQSAKDKPLTDAEIMKIVTACLDGLEDCASRFPPHYKAIYRLAHYHFYYKKGKDIERCRDLMLSNFTTRSGQKLGGLFSERKYSNFFNNIWKIPLVEVDRAGGFAFHMNRSVLLTMEILKEIDDHKTLLDLSLHLQRIPEPDKKYLRDSDREELAQQALSLCVQSLKGQLLKFSQQADLKSNEVERQALKSLMLDIYRAYQRAQKQPNSKQFTNLLIDAYKLVSTTPTTENMNLVDISMKYCQSLIQALKQQATQASLDKSQNAQKKHTAKIAAAAEAAKAAITTISTNVTITSTNTTTTTTTVSTTQNKPDYKPPPTSSSTSASLPKLSVHEMAAAFQTLLPVLNDPVLQTQTAAALTTYIRNINALAGLTPTNTSSLHNNYQNSFQAEFYRQFLTQNLPPYNPPPPKKQKRGPKSSNTQTRPAPVGNTQAKSFKSYNSTSLPPVSKSTSTSSPLAPSMGTVLASLPASMTMNLASFGGSSLPAHTHTSSHSLPAQAHISSASTMSAALHTKPPMPHQQVSPGKTLQEKLAERQKNMPSMTKSTKETNTTRSTSTKQSATDSKKSDARKTLPFGDRYKSITSDVVIVLDDD